MDFDEVWQDDEEMPAEMPGFEDEAKDDVRYPTRTPLQYGFSLALWIELTMAYIFKPFVSFFDSLASTETRPDNGF